MNKKGGVCVFWVECGWNCLKMLVWTVVAIFVRRYSFHNTQYTLTMWMEITTSRHRRFWNEFFMLSVDSYDNDNDDNDNWRCDTFTRTHLTKTSPFISYVERHSVLWTPLKVCSFPRKERKPCIPRSYTLRHEFFGKYLCCCSTQACGDGGNAPSNQLTEIRFIKRTISKAWTTRVC